MLITKAFPFLMVTLLMPVTGLSPILVIAFLNFFSPLLDLGSICSSSTSSASTLFSSTVSSTGFYSFTSSAIKSKQIYIKI